jgi:hypothetical protein
MPAFRVIYNVPSQADLEHIKFASAAFADKLYEFQYNRMPVLGECDAPPLSEEAVHEHLLSTFEFYD